MLDFEVDCVGVLVIPPSEVAVIVGGICRNGNSIFLAWSCWSNCADFIKFSLVIGLTEGSNDNSLCERKWIRCSDVDFTVLVSEGKGMGIVDGINVAVSMTYSLCVFGI